MLEGTGRLRVGAETLTVPRYGGVLVGPDPLRRVFNDTGRGGVLADHRCAGRVGVSSTAKVPEPDLSLIYPTDPTQLPRNLPA